MSSNVHESEPLVDGGDGKGRAGHGGKPWDGMNGIAANLLLNLTSGMRFEGALNVDINDITMNLVPFPRLKFLLSSMSPVAGAYTRPLLD
jgi:tubulin epsilon